MSRSIQPRATLSVKRLVLLTIALTPAVLLVLIALVRLGEIIPRWVYWKAALIGLIVAEFAYTVTATIVVLGTLVLGVVLIRTRGSPGSRRRVFAARGLLLCVSLVTGLVLAEAIGAVWLIRSHQSTALPAGGLRPKSRTRSPPRSSCSLPSCWEWS